MDSQTSAGSETARQRPPVLVISFCYNETIKIRRTVERFCRSTEWDMWVVDDGSTDGCTDTFENDYGIRVIRHDRNRGIGAAIRTGLQHFGASEYQVAVLIAGNDKDRPEDVMKASNPVLQGEKDLIQGSRYLPGGFAGNTPGYRLVATRYLHPLLFNLVTGQRFTDTTNGFKAVHRRIVEEARVDLSSPKLDKYELEPYFLLKTVMLGYRVGEVPVSKIYPEGKLSYTKMKPIVGWWSILRPLVYVGLGIWK